jgi:DNA-binding transcriptional ArsR family regulator
LQALGRFAEGADLPLLVRQARGDPPHLREDGDEKHEHHRERAEACHAESTGRLHSFGGSVFHSGRSCNWGGGTFSSSRAGHVSSVCWWEREGSTGMTIAPLIHAIVRQTTILIAQLATARGLRAPLAQVANQVFLDLVTELERQGVSRKVSADMFGLGLRTYRRKIQQLSESSTERGRSLSEVILEHVRGRGLVTRTDVLTRFPDDDEALVRAVLHDLCESQLVFVSGTGLSTTYRAASEEELDALQRRRGTDGTDELLVALMYREGPLTAKEIATRAQADPEEVGATLTRLSDAGRIERLEQDGTVRFKAGALVIPLGAPVGWEAAMFDHFKAMVTTILCRLRDNEMSAAIADRNGGSTYTIDVWPGHPLADEVYGTLGRLRTSLSDLRARVDTLNGQRPIPDSHTRVVIYAGQCVIQEDHEHSE